jgi:hypothetical protein
MAEPIEDESVVSIQDGNVLRGRVPTKILKGLGFEGDGDGIRWTIVHTKDGPAAKAVRLPGAAAEISARSKAAQSGAKKGGAKRAAKSAGNGKGGPPKVGAPVVGRKSDEVDSAFTSVEDDEFNEGPPINQPPRVQVPAKAAAKPAPVPRPAPPRVAGPPAVGGKKGSAKKASGVRFK